MIDHMTYRVKNIATTKTFFSECLSPLGYRLAYEGSPEGTKILGFESAGKIDTWFVETDESKTTRKAHLAWLAPSRAAVDGFYQRALAAGGKCNGKPGPRPHYHEHYYGAFVIDPDGNNIEAVCHSPA